MKKILWVSPYVPYDTVNHAGGQTENFYVKGLKKYGFDVRVLSFCTEDELGKIDLDRYGIEYDVILLERDFTSKIKRTFKYNLIESKYNPFNRYGNLVSNNFIYEVLNHCQSYKTKAYDPDIIVLEWTEAALLTKKIKGIYPHAKIMCIEEDVAYLGYKRHIDYEKRAIWKVVWMIRYKNLKKEELNALMAAEYIGCLNEKDCKLLCSDGIDENKVFKWIPYFKQYSFVNRNPSPKCKILFFGNMAREENYASVIWFINNVIPLLSKVDFEFNVVGAKPSQSLKKYESDKVHIIGFVKDIRPYFEDSLCIVAPLVLGAGIKIKVLEALSAGMPVLTNDIGIEGIPAQNGKEYIHCNEPNEYAKYIKQLHENRNLARKFSRNASSFIMSHYDLKQSMESFCELMGNV